MNRRRFTLAETATTIDIVFATEADYFIDHERRSREARLLVTRALRPHAQVAAEQGDGKLLFQYPASQKKMIRQIITELVEKIDRLFNEPLTPKMADQYLILPRESVYVGTKDGRLPTCGMGSHRRGNHKMQFPLFPIAAIDALVAYPSIVDEWRRVDASIEQ